MGILEYANYMADEFHLPRPKGEWPEVKPPKTYADEMSWAEAHGAYQDEEGEWVC